MSLTDDQRRQLLAGAAYTNPWSQPPAQPYFGTRLMLAAQSFEDVTIPHLCQQMEILGRRVALLEAQDALLWAALRQGEDG